MAMVSIVKGSVFGRLNFRNSWYVLSTMTMISPWQLCAKLTQLLGTYSEKVSAVQYINSVSSILNRFYSSELIFHCLISKSRH